MSQDFAAACQVYYDRVYRFLLALSGNPNQAEDLLPLYVDGCCTQSSRELVEEHLQEAVKAAQLCGMEKQELVETLNVLWEE